MDSPPKQVFLGGACGISTWRRDIAIPLLEAAGISYHDPQLGPGEWTPAQEQEEMHAKAAADVLLFVINGETRGVAGIAEVAYSLGCGRRLAVVVTDIERGAADECDDLNRGRIFIRSMAREHGVPVFTDVESATRYAIDLVRAGSATLDAPRLRSILDAVRFKTGGFEFEEIAGGFLIRLRCQEIDVETGRPEVFYGRKWYIADTASESDVVRTAFKAAVTWQEHEAREGFTYRGSAVFGPHSDVEVLTRLDRRKS